jgi:hypothetical protein
MGSARTANCRLVCKYRDIREQNWQYYSMVPCIYIYLHDVVPMDLLKSNASCEPTRFFSQRMTLTQAHARLRAHRDHAKCNIQSRAVPVAQLIKVQKCPLKTLNALTLSIPYSNAKCFSTKWQQRQRRCLAERVSN